MGKIGGRRLWPWLETLLIGAILLIIFCTQLATVPFFPDESHWIGSSGVFEVFFTGQLGSPLWQESYWTLTQPPLTRYLIGVGRRLGGYTAAELNATWEFSLSDEENLARHALPEPGLLWWSRLPMAVIAAGCGLLLFELMRAARNRVAAYTLLVLYAANSYLAYILRRAMAEAPLLLFTLLAGWASAKAIQSWQRAVAIPSATSAPAVRRFPGVERWWLLAGLFSGLAAAVKLNGALAGMAAGGLAMLAPLRYRGTVVRRARLDVLERSLLWVLLATGVVFMMVNPYLYPDPLGRTARMLKMRTQEMQQQWVQYPETHSQEGAARLAQVAERVFQDYATWRFPGAPLVNGALCLLGLGYLLWTTYRWWRGGEQFYPSIVSAAMALSLVAPMLLSPLDWDRYYLFPVIFSLWCMALGGAQGVEIATRILVRRDL